MIILAALGCAEPTVTRIVDGRPTEGRFISGAAYAFFARGAEAETAGDLGRALRAFELAAQADPESPEIWTRIGALHCRAEPEGALPARAAAAFERARAIDPDHGPLYRERARCLSTRTRFHDAELILADADRALALDPDDLDTAMVRAFVLDRTGKPAEAIRALRALTIRKPSSAEPWRALHDLARRTGDAALADAAAERIAALVPGARRTLPQTAPFATIDRALRAGDLAAAQRRALELRIPGAELALRAVAMGLVPIARAQGELILGADPADASARIALAAAADLQGDLAALSDLMRSMPKQSTPPSPLGRWLFADVLRRRVSAEAALAWLGDAREESPGDPLLSATEKRVRKALASP